MKFKDRVALVTGGTRMGEAVAVRLAEEGCHVALTYRTRSAAARKTAAKVRSRKREALVVQADLRRDEDIQGVIESIRRRFARLDILIHMASVYEKKPFSDLEIKDWDKTVNVDLRSAYGLALGAAALMRKNRWGRIVHFSDWLAASGRPRYRGYGPYFVAKSGVLGLAQMLALELAPEILVNAVAPGPILPPKGLGAAEVRRVIEATPLGRWGGVGEIVRTVLFLLETGFVTGECIRVDGGRHLY
ncbi:MAG: SDR family oxidoreductase [Candidatus Omnitrophica bacterium]|nr:SDR family oxidoreductase [Candidatus Omnitrophota bacterium]